MKYFSDVLEKISSVKYWAGMHKTFLLKRYRNQQIINQIYNFLASKLLPAVILEVTSSLSWLWSRTLWWSNIFQDMVPTVQPIISYREWASDFFLKQGSKVYFSRYWGRKSLNFPGSLGRPAELVRDINHRTTPKWAQTLWQGKRKSFHYELISFLLKYWRKMSADKMAWTI